ncbi:MAG: hypothetical protein E7342_01445 [Clostridiales bacterium]|nr:hypothetical protein [Clostridiales bacterium]
MAGDRIAIDFGSSYTNIYKQGYGVVLSEPTVACLEVDVKGKNKIKAVGLEAKRYIGKTGSNSKIIFPVFEGEIVNETVAKEVLSTFLKKIEFKKGIGSTVLFSVPAGSDGSYFSKLKKLSYELGIGKTEFIESPVLSALGQDITLNATNPYFVIEFGGGSTNMGMVSLDGVVAGFSVNIGSSKIDADIIDLLIENFGLQVGLQTAEKIKINVGSLVEKDTMSIAVSGRCVETGKPKSISVSSKDIVEVIKKYYDKIADLAQALLAKLPVEASAEIRENGIFLSGGPSMIYGIEDYFAQKFSIKVVVANDGPYSVIKGAGALLGKPTLLKKLNLEK